MIPQKQSKSKIIGIMKLECAVKRRSENTKRIMEPQRHIEIINGTSFKGSFTPLLNSIKLFFTESAKSSKSNGDETQSRKQITE